MEMIRCRIRSNGRHCWQWKMYFAGIDRCHPCRDGCLRLNQKHNHCEEKKNNQADFRHLCRQ